MRHACRCWMPFSAPYWYRMPCTWKLQPLTSHSLSACGTICRTRSARSICKTMFTLMLLRMQARPPPCCFTKNCTTDYLLIDDKRCRKVATINHIKTIGPLGVLLQAKRAGLIPLIAPLLSQIQASPVYIGQSLIETVLELAGESKILPRVGP